jgi:hypothetical protein
MIAETIRLLSPPRPWLSAISGQPPPEIHTLRLAWDAFANSFCQAPQIGTKGTGSASKPGGLLVWMHVTRSPRQERRGQNTARIVTSGYVIHNGWDERAEVSSQYF